MRVLAGPLIQESHYRLPPLSDGPHELRVFGADAPIPYQIGESWEVLLDRLPDGWWPDVVLWLAPEFRPWPVGDCPLPLVAVVGDWNLNFSVLREVLKRCDYIVTDRGGVARLRKLGYENVAYWPAYGFAPEVHHPYPDLPIQFDILFIGNLNHEVHRRRARLLARLAKLSDRYRVAILQGLYGQEYAKALASSRIVVNQSIRGEMNMRAYEAPACGALLFMERDNLEVRDFFQDGEECVLYGEDDLETLLEQYLTDEGLRARVAAAGHAQVQTETYQAHLQALLDRLSELDWEALRTHRQRWDALSPAERHYYTGRWFLQCGYALFLARDEVERAARLAPEEPEYANALATVEGFMAVLLRDAGYDGEAQVCAGAARERWQKLLKRWPDYALAWTNLGRMWWLLEQPEAGASALHRALDLLHTAPERAFSREGCYLPTPTYTTFSVEWERAVAEHANDQAGILEALRALLRWECARRLGELALRDGAPDRARTFFEVAIAARPDLEAGHAGLGAALEALGELKTAIASCETALALQPWDFTTRRRLASLLRRVGEGERCSAVCREGLALARACPRYRQTARPLADLLVQDPLQQADAAVARGDLSTARNILERAIAVCPDSVAARVALASVAMAQEDHWTACDQLIGALEMEPENPELHNQLGVAYCRAGDHKMAQQAFQQALALDSTHRNALMNLAEVAQVQGRYDDAARHLLHALEAHPDDPEVLTAFGQFAMQIGEPEIAQMAMEKAVQRALP